MNQIIFIFLLAAILVGCSSAPHKSSNTTRYQQVTNKHQQKAIINNARAMLGVKYYYGGSSANTGFDCSGLVYYSYLKQGIKIPRTTTAQLKTSRKIPKSALRVGDLVFFAINGSKVSHVGIFLGNNKFIHAPSTGKKVNITTMDSKYWRKRFITGGRI